MKFDNVNPFELVANPWNSNKVDRDNFEKLKKSLQRHGSFKPIIVRTLSTGQLEILGGFHRAEAAKELGLTEVPICNLGTMDDSKAKEITLIDNTRYGQDDEELLEKLLSEITDLEGLNQIVPEEVELPELDEPDTTLPETPAEKEEDEFEILKFRFDDLDKAEEIKAVLAKVAYSLEFKHKDGYADYPAALYHLLMVDRNADAA
jgi:hypothetical protein